MPATVKVRVVEARDLPVMDQRTELTDAYVEVKIKDKAHETSIAKKTLNPVWNTDFRFHLEDTGLQDEVLEIKVYDYDKISSDDAIGKVYISLGSLLLADKPMQLAGWYPIYDTIRGIRGEINIAVKIELVQNQNPHSDSSVGVKIFAMSVLPPGFRLVAMHGFVEELVVDNDPEFHWVDNFRTPRSSNEARQRLFYRLSNELQRKIGLKALEAGANAVVGYQQSFDVEEQYGLVARGIGTAVTLVSTQSDNPQDQLPATMPLVPSTSSNAVPIVTQPAPLVSVEPASLPEVTSAAVAVPDAVAEDPLAGTSSVPPADFYGSSGTPGTTLPKLFKQSSHIKRRFGQDDVPLITLIDLPPGMLESLGGVVTARSVKLLDKIKEPDEPETRDAWWMELREEAQAHARTLGCNAVIGYRESTTICNELCVLSATGTAAKISATPLDAVEEDQRRESRDERTAGQGAEGGQTSPSTRSRSNSHGLDPRISILSPSAPPTAGNAPPPLSLPAPARCRSTRPFRKCNFAHIPYQRHSMAFPMEPERCQMCRKKYVPQFLFSTTDLPAEADVVAQGESIEARVCRPKKREKGEINAINVSEAIPFVEYDMHKQLMNKLRVRGMNAIFGLRIQISVGETMIVCLAVGTAVFLKALPTPPQPVFSTRKGGALETVPENDEFGKIKQKIIEVAEANRAVLARASAQSQDPDQRGGESGRVAGQTGSWGAGRMEGSVVEEGIGRRQAGEGDASQPGTLDKDSLQGELSSSSSSSEDEGPDRGQDRPSQVMEVDDEADEDSMMVLLDPPSPVNFTFCTTQALPGLPPGTETYAIQMVSTIRRQIVDVVPDRPHNRALARAFQQMQQALCFKLRRFAPAICANLRYDIQMSEGQDEAVLITSTAMVLGTRPVQPPPAEAPQISDDALVFTIDPDTERSKRMAAPRTGTSRGTGTFVEMTSMNYIPGARLDRYLGQVSLVFIKESNAIREPSAMNQFIHVFVMEAQAVARAHVRALGGNALAAYKMQEFNIMDSPHKNQGYVLLAITGDVYECSRPPHVADPQQIISAACLGGPTIPKGTIAN